MIVPSATGGRRIWLLVGSLLDGVSTEPMRDAHLVYDEKGVLYVGTDSPPVSVLNAGQSAADLELPEYTVLPGLDRGTRTPVSRRRRAGFRRSVLST